MHTVCVSVHTCGLCVCMGERVHAYSVCECPYMWFMCVDGGGGACIQCECPYMWCMCVDGGGGECIRCLRVFIHVVYVCGWMDVCMHE